MVHLLSPCFTYTQGKVVLDLAKKVKTIVAFFPQKRLKLRVSFVKRFENSWISIIRGLQFAAQINAWAYLTYEMRLRRAAPGGGMITALRLPLPVRKNIHPLAIFA